MTGSGHDPVARRAALEHVTTLLAGSLSEGRRRRAILDSGPGRAFQTDLSTIAVPFPPAAGASLRMVTCALALQASPTKEAAARLPWTALGARRRTALAWVEGEMAVRWAKGHWPGLRDDLQAAFPWVQDGPVVLEAGALAALAAQRARSGRLGDPPPLFGRLPPPTRDVGGLVRRTFIATRWSSRHKARREGALPIPVSGPGTEPVLHPGEPGTMEALEGRAGHELGIPYDEWDCWKGRYRRGYVRVMELDAPGSEGPRAPVLALPRLHAARSRRRHFEDGDVDIDAVVAWRCELASGHQSGEPRLFNQLTAVTEPTAWALLVDASASASLSGGRLMRAGLRHADALAATLCAQGERVGVFAFRSRARERIEIRTLKHFDRPYRPLTRELKPGGYTRLGGAIRHCGARLSAVAARAHVLVYLGDAVPYDEGYGESYGRADVAKAVEELRGSGLLVHHASLAHTQDELLDQMFGPAGWRTTRSGADLVRLVGAVQDELNREL